MAYFRDLTPYSYSVERSSAPALNIGWLDRAEPFEKGHVPDGFVGRLRRLLLNPTHRTRGFHICQFCPDLHKSVLARDSFDRELYEQCFKDGRLSSSEIRVRGRGGQHYAAPGMIAHYAEAHSYRPPQEFIDAVMEDETLA